MFGSLFKKPRQYPASVDQLQGEIWVIQGTRLGEKWSLDGGDVKVGRAMSDEEVAAAAGRAISFPDHCKLISGNHAVFSKKEDGYWIIDQGSKNGTLLDDKRIDKHLLMDGDEVDIGQVVFKVKIHAPPGAGPQRTCTFTVSSGPRQGEAFTLADGELLVGRELVGERVVSFAETEREISTEHAVFKKVKNGFWVQDKGSKNGTFVNSQRVELHELKDHDKIGIGSVTFEARIAG